MITQQSHPPVAKDTLLRQHNLLRLIPEAPVLLAPPYFKKN